jgi:hypothetical protein
MLVYAVKRILRHTTTVQDLTVVAVAEKDKEARSDLVIACDGERGADPRPWIQSNPYNVDGIEEHVRACRDRRLYRFKCKFKKCKMETEDENPKKWIRELHV